MAGICVLSQRPEAEPTRHPPGSPKLLGLFQEPVPVSFDGPPTSGVLDAADAEPGNIRPLRSALSHPE